VKFKWLRTQKDIDMITTYAELESDLKESSKFTNPTGGGFSLFI